MKPPTKQIGNATSSTDQQEIHEVGKYSHPSIFSDVHYVNPTYLSLSFEVAFMFATSFS